MKVHFRVSLDYADPVRHDAARGAGMFARALEGLRALEMGFHVSVAHQSCRTWHRMPLRLAAEVFRSVGTRAFDADRVSRISSPTRADVAVPVTGRCMADFHSEETRRSFMCSFSRMIT